MSIISKIQKFRVEGKRSPEWPKVRADFLKKNPSCRACGSTKSLQVHHKMPFHLCPKLELDENNLITLCEGGIVSLGGQHECHYVFGHFYDWKAYNPNVVMDAGEYNRNITNNKKV